MKMIFPQAISWQFNAFFLFATFFIACPLSFKVVRITATSTIDEGSATFPVKIEASKFAVALTRVPWKKAGVTSLLACGKCVWHAENFEPVGIAKAPTIGEFFTFSSHFVKIVAWKGRPAWTRFLWKNTGVTSLPACLKTFEPVGIATAPTIDEFFTFSSHFVKIVAWKVRQAWTPFLWKNTGVTSLQACGKTFEPVGIATAPTIDEFFTFSSHFVKIEPWNVRIAMAAFLW